MINLLTLSVLQAQSDQFHQTRYKYHTPGDLSNFV